LAVRRTGEYRIHLIGKAFGPLGGDAVIIRLQVETGARLEVCSVAAAVCLPSRDPAPSRAELHADVAAGGRLDVLLEPTVVAAGAEHRARTVIALAAGASAHVTERVVLGRHAEEPGRWMGTTRVERAGRPLLHTCVDLGPGSPMWRAPTMPRAYATDLTLATLPPEMTADVTTPESKSVAPTPESKSVAPTPESKSVAPTPESKSVAPTPATSARSRTGPSSVLLPLAGGWLSTGWGDRLEQVLAAITDLTRVDHRNCAGFPIQNPE
jgi:urease accessory protein